MGKKQLLSAKIFLTLILTLIPAIIISSCSPDKGAAYTSNLLEFAVPENAALTIRDVRVKGFTLDWDNIPGDDYEYAVAASSDGHLESYETALENNKILLHFTPSGILNGTYRATKMIPGKEYTIKLFVRTGNTKPAEYLETKAVLPYVDDAEILSVHINGIETVYSKEDDSFSYYYFPGISEEDDEDESGENKGYTFTYKLLRGCALYINGVKTEAEEIPVVPFEPLEVTAVNERTLAARDYIIQVDTIDNGIPVVIINTEDNRRIRDKDVRKAAHIEIIDSRSNPYGIGLYSGAIEIKGRGNSSFGMPKKGYNLEIAEKVQILDMPSSRDWMLMANYSDKSLMRNYTAYELSRDMGAEFAAKLRYVDLVFNGDYLGNYVLGERVKIDDGRLNLEKIKADTTDEYELTGGYVLEVNSTDKYSPTEIIFETDKVKLRKGHFFSIKQPSAANITPEAYEYIKNYVNETENALFSDDFTNPETGYRAYIDTASVIDWYLVNELYKQVDANFHTSVYLYKPRGEKLHMGPVWDFDLGAGNADYSGCDNPKGWYVRNADWITRMFEDETFAAEFKERWNYVKERYFDGLFKRIDDTAKFLEKSQKTNFERWPILGTYVWPNAGNVSERTTYQSEIDYLKEWLTLRIEWMDEEINKNP